MQRIATLLVAAIVLVACNATGGGGADIAAETERVRAQEQAFIAALAGRSPQAVAAFYTTDARRYLPFSPPQGSPDSILQGRVNLFSDVNGAAAMTPENIYVPTSADYAITEGMLVTTFTNAATSAPANTSAHYVIVWRREEDGSWKILREALTPAAATP